MKNWVIGLILFLAGGVLGFVVLEVSPDANWTLGLEVIPLAMMATGIGYFFTPDKKTP